MAVGKAGGRSRKRRSKRQKKFDVSVERPPAPVKVTFDPNIKRKL